MTRYLQPPSPHLPPLGALLGELGEVDRLLGVLLAVLLSTRLHEEGVRRRLPLRLVDVFTHHRGGLKNHHRRRRVRGTESRGSAADTRYAFIDLVHNVVHVQ